jgi:hypothetical protein
LPEAFWDGSQILADKQALVTVALQRQNADEVFQRISQVGPFNRDAAFRDAEEALKAHHMINPQGSGVAHVGTDKLDEGQVASLPECIRLKWGDPPILTRRVEDIGWRSDARARQNSAIDFPEHDVE